MNVTRAIAQGHADFGQVRPSKGRVGGPLESRTARAYSPPLATATLPCSRPMPERSGHDDGQTSSTMALPDAPASTG